MRQSEVLAVVAWPRLLRLRAALEGRAGLTLHGVVSWSEAVTCIRHAPIELLVVDPLVGGEPRLHEIERLRALFPSLPVVVYTELRPDVAGSLLALGRLGIRRVLLQRFDDAPAAIGAVLESELTQGTVQQEVLGVLRGWLGGLPPALAGALAESLRLPLAPVSVGALASRAGMARRTCERWFARAALPSPRVVVGIARLLHAYRLLQDPGYTVADVARRLGFGGTRTLQLWTRDVFGLSAGELRVGLTWAEALARIEARYFPRLERRAS